MSKQKIDCCVSLVYQKRLSDGGLEQTLLGYLTSQNGKDEFDLKAEAEHYHSQNNADKIIGKSVVMWQVMLAEIN